MQQQGDEWSGPDLRARHQHSRSQRSKQLATDCVTSIGTGSAIRWNEKEEA
jgi:hypothetical protein